MLHAWQCTWLELIYQETWAFVKGKKNRVYDNCARHSNSWNPVRLEHCRRKYHQRVRQTERGCLEVRLSAAPCLTHQKAADVCSSLTRLKKKIAEKTYCGRVVWMKLKSLLVCSCLCLQVFDNKCDNFYLVAITVWNGALNLTRSDTNWMAEE